MSVRTIDGVTTLKPTAWKWFGGALAVFFLVPGFGWMLAGVFALMGMGNLQNLKLSPQGLRVRNWWSTKEYAWAEISDFRVYKVRSGLVTAANMISFTQAQKDGSMMGSAAKLLVGGTDTVPAVGMKADKLVQLMEAYKRGFVPSDTVEEEAKLSPALPMFTPPQASEPERAIRETAHPRAVPATPRMQNRKASSQPKLGGTRKPSSPLVQEGGGLFGRRRSDSPFSS